MVLSKVGRAERVRLACIGLSASALAAMALPVKFATPAEAKTPGSTYCYLRHLPPREDHRGDASARRRRRGDLSPRTTTTAAHDRYNPCGLTSSGEQFHADRPDNTASPIYPDGTTLLVWSPDTERALVVRVNNAGPYWGNRTLDLSRAAAEKLGFEKSGVAKRAGARDQGARARRRQLRREPHLSAGSGRHRPVRELDEPRRPAWPWRWRCRRRPPRRSRR